MSNNESNIKDNDSIQEVKTIKFGIISQSTPTLNALNFFQSFFDYSKPSYSLIKSELNFIYSPKENINLSLNFHIIRDVKKLKEYYNKFNSFLLMVDLQRKDVINETEFFIDSLLEASDFNLKKIYIFAFYKGDVDLKDKVNDFLSMIDAKDIEFELLDLNIQDLQEFSNIMTKIYKEVKVKVIENMKDNKHSELKLDIDASKSKCQIF